MADAEHQPEQRTPSGRALLPMGFIGAIEQPPLPAYDLFGGRFHGRSRRLGELGELVSRGRMADAHDRLLGIVAIKFLAFDRDGGFVERFRRGPVRPPTSASRTSSRPPRGFRTMSRIHEEGSHASLEKQGRRAGYIHGRSGRGRLRSGHG
jgi:hypothetical protein